jgi:hypothetical protein
MARPEHILPWVRPAEMSAEALPAWPALAQFARQHRWIRGGIPAPLVLKFHQGPLQRPLARTITLGPRRLADHVAASSLA